MVGGAVVALVVGATISEHEAAALNIRQHLEDLVVFVPPGGFGKSRNDFADGITIGVDGALRIAEKVAHGESVRALEGAFEDSACDAKPDETLIRLRQV